MRRLAPCPGPVTAATVEAASQAGGRGRRGCRRPSRAAARARRAGRGRGVGPRRRGGGTNPAVGEAEARRAGTHDVGAVVAPVGHEGDAVEVGDPGEVEGVGEVGVGDDHPVEARARPGAATPSVTAPLRPRPGLPDDLGAEVGRPRRDLVVVADDRDAEVAGGGARRWWPSRGPASPGPARRGPRPGGPWPSRNDLTGRSTATPGRRRPVVASGLRSAARGECSGSDGRAWRSIGGH